MYFKINNFFQILMCFRKCEIKSVQVLVLKHYVFTQILFQSTVLSIVNCPVRYDRYRKGVVASPNSKTLIIISPDCAEANRLSQHSKHRTQSIDILESGHTSFTVGNVDDRLLQSLPMGYKTAQPEVRSWKNSL